jgi:hypothetical protein
MIHNTYSVNLLAIYRPPAKRNIPEFTAQLDAMLSRLSDNELVFVCGDINIDMINPDNNENNFIETMRSNSFLPLISRPTRVTEYSTTLIDHTWTKSLINFTSGVFDSNITDHYITFTFIPLKTPDNFTFVKFRDLSAKSLSLFETNMNKFLCDQFTLYNGVDFETRFSVFFDQMYVIYDKYCPMRRKKI